jgi:hypothetical protein
MPEFAGTQLEIPRHLRSAAFLSFRRIRAHGSESLVVSKGNGEDAPVEVLDTRTRERPEASGYQPTSEAVVAVLLELPRA